MPTSFWKYIRAACPIPWMLNEPTWPRYTSFMYSSRMSFFCARRSSTKASSASWALRRNVRSGVRKKFFTSCWVMVLPPWM